MICYEILWPSDRPSLWPQFTSASKKVKAMSTFQKANILNLVKIVWCYLIWKSFELSGYEGHIIATYLFVNIKRCYLSSFLKIWTMLLSLSSPPTPPPCGFLKLVPSGNILVPPSFLSSVNSTIPEWSCPRSCLSPHPPPCWCSTTPPPRSCPAPPQKPGCIQSQMETF